MVGAKSLGCTTCKRRKVKCDERFPTCANCERTRRHCTGPKSRFIRYVEPGAEEHMNGHEVEIIKFSIQPGSSRSQLIAADLASRLSGIEQIGYKLQLFGQFMSYLPSRVGHNPALDAALRCLLVAHQGLTSRRTTSFHADLHDYNEALSLVRKDLDLLRDKTPSETVCAAMILSTYEVFKRSPGRAWIAHAGGVAALIEAWGPDHIVSDFDLAIFASYYGSIASSCLLRGKDCFLTTPAWEAVRIRCLNMKESRGTDECISDSLTVLAWLPNVLNDIRNPTQDPYCSPIRTAWDFKAKVAKNAIRMENELENPLIVCESPAPYSSFMPTKYDFGNIQFVSRYGSYWATTIIANTILARVGDTDPLLAQETQCAADNICKSFEYIRLLKPIGVLSAILWASMAFGVSSTERRPQIVMKLKELLEPLPVSTGASEMQNIFSVATGHLTITDIYNQLKK